LFEVIRKTDDGAHATLMRIIAIYSYAGLIFETGGMVGQFEKKPDRTTFLPGEDAEALVIFRASRVSFSQPSIVR
jgi:hypothetical protein